MKYLLTLAALLTVTLESIAQYEYYDSSDDIYNLVVETEVVVLDDCIAADLSAGEVFVHRFYVEAESADDQLRAVFGEDQEDINLPFSISAPGGIWNHPEGTWYYHVLDPQLLQSFPCLEYDSFVTIGFSQVQIIASDDEVTNFFELNTAGQSAELAVNGGDEFVVWFTFEDYPDESGRWQILQVTSSEHVNGVLNCFILSEEFGNYNGELIATKHFDTQPLCSDESACNFVADAFNGEGVCDYSCCPGPGCCHEGTIWDSNLQQCIVANPSDSNFDGCVQLNDLLDLLGAYGNCAATESAWECSELFEYQGYHYTTVLIGDQCWFAENLRNENYENGDAIPADLSDSEWLNTTSGAVAVYGEDAGCNNYSPDFNACDPVQSLNEYGRLYNWYAVDDARGLCPSGWHVPTDGEWTVMTDFLGEESVVGGQMKTTYGWNNGGNGTNLSGFSGSPGGFRFYVNAEFGNAGFEGFWWSSSPDGSLAYYRNLYSSNEVVFRSGYNRRSGFSVRCVRDAE